MFCYILLNYGKMGIAEKKGGTLRMITVSLEAVYYVVVIASILCGASYKLGYEMGKHTKR